MPRVHPNVVLVIAALACLVVSGPAARLASSAAPDPLVTIRIVRTPRVAELQVHPRGVGICKNPTADCGGAVLWTSAPGNGAPEPDEYLLITHKHPGQPSAECFAAGSYEITAESGSVSSGPVQDGCTTPTAWFYTVELRRQAGGPGPDDDIVVAGPLDPGVIIDRGSL